MIAQFQEIPLQQGLWLTKSHRNIFLDTTDFSAFSPSPGYVILYRIDGDMIFTNVGLIGTVL
jgi:hypothetical protein